MSSSLSFFLHNFNPDSKRLLEQFSNGFNLYSIESFQELKNQMSRHCKVVFCEDDFGDSNAQEVLVWLQAHVPKVIRVLITSKKSLNLQLQFARSPLVHKILFKEDDIDEESLLNLQIEINKLNRLLHEKQKFQELSMTDPVTELTNHRFFQENLRLEIQKAKRAKSAISLIMADVDHFKLLNDRFGHPKGDEVLYKIGQAIQSHLPQGATVSRYGGEEFAIILPKTPSAKAFAISELIREQVINLGDTDVRTSLSLGVASYPEHGLDADELLAVSDQALYCAKRQGRNISIVGTEEYI